MSDQIEKANPGEESIPAPAELQAYAFFAKAEKKIEAGMLKPALGLSDRE